MKNKSEKGKKSFKGGKAEKIKKTAMRTIFIGGIPLQSKPKEIATYLSQYDVVESLKVPKDPTSGKLKGFAKAVLKTLEGVERIVSEPCHYIGGLKVGISQWKDTSDYVQEKKDESDRKVYIKYPPGLSTNVLVEYLQLFGDIQNVDHKRNPHTNKHRYFCYVTYLSTDSVTLILRNQEHWIGGFLVIAELSKPLHPNSHFFSEESDNPRYEKMEHESDHNKFKKLKLRSESPQRVRHLEGCKQVLHPEHREYSSNNFRSDPQADVYESSLQEKWERTPRPEDFHNPTSQIRIHGRISEEKILPYNHIPVRKFLFSEQLPGISLNHLNEANLRFNICLVPLLLNYPR